MTKARKTSLFFLGVTVFYLLFCMAILPALPDKYLGNNSLSVISQGLILIPGLVYVIAEKGEPLKNIGTKRLGIINVFLIMLYALLLVPLMSFVNTFSMIFAKNYMTEHLDDMSPNPFWLNIVLIAVMPALVEEFTFRGIIYTGYRDSVIKRAVFASAAAFGLFHMNMNQFCYATAMGVFFALLYEATGSIFASMVAHFTLNANSLVLDKLLTAYTNYISRMAQNDPDYAQIAEELSNSESQTIADYTLADKIATLRSLFIFAAIGTTLAILLLAHIAKRSGRKEHLRRINASVCGNDKNMWKVENSSNMAGKSPMMNNWNYAYGNNSYVTPSADGKIGIGVYTQNGYSGSNEYGGKIADKVFITAVILCVLCMV